MSFIYDSIKIDNRLDVTSNGKIITRNKGDLIVDNGTKTTALTVGVNGQVLTVDTTQQEGIKWKSLLASDIIDFDANVSNNDMVVSSIIHVNNTSNPHNVTKDQLGLSDVINLKHKLDGTTRPTSNDDILSGYLVGSRWIDIINEKEYVCINNTSTESIWIETTTQIQNNTISNVGTTGFGIYKQKTLYDFEFKTINAGSSKLSISDDVLNDKLDIDIIESNININNLNGAPIGAVIGTIDVQTLINKTFLGNSTYFQDSVDNTKKMQLSLSGIATNTTRTLTVPDADTIIVGHDTYQTLENKIIDANNNTIINIDNNVIKANANIDATKLADGSISNIEFQYLGGITSGVVAINDIQTIFNKTFGDNLNMDNNRIINIASPINSTDVANKDYVDNVTSRLNVKALVKLATTNDLNSNSSIDGIITYTNTGGVSGRGQIIATLLENNVFIVDGVTLTSIDDGTRILIKNQTNGDENGIWVTTINGTLLTLDRAIDFDGDYEVFNGLYVFIEEGTTLTNTGFILSTNNPITIGGISGTVLTFLQLTGTNNVVAGLGLTNVGNTINVLGSSTIIANSDSLEVNSSNILNQVLLSSGTVGTSSTFGSLPLDNNNSVSGLLPISNGGTNVASFASGNRLIATNIENTLLEASNIEPSLVVLTNSTQTLTNKTFTDNTTYFQDNVDNTKKLQLSLSNISSDTMRIITVPNANTTIVGNDTIQTITNKTIDAVSNSIFNIDNINIKDGAGIDATKIADGTVTNSEFQYLNGITSDIVSVNNIQTIINKTFTDNSTYFQDNLDNTKKIQFQLDNISTGTTKTFIFPDVDTTLVGTDAIQTLTNKTFTFPRIQTAINDINDNELIKFIYNIDAVNEITIENKITNNSPSISATGNDTNINLDINAKGTGNVIISSLKFPNIDGVADQVIKTDGFGNLSFTTVSVENIHNVTTNNNIATTICTTSTTNNTAYLIETSIVGIRTDAKNEGAGFILRSIFRNDDGVLTKISEDKMYGKDSAWDVSSVISGENIIITVTGETSKTIKWKANHKILSI